MIGAFKHAGRRRMAFRVGTKMAKFHQSVREEREREGGEGECRGGRSVREECEGGVWRREESDCLVRLGRWREGRREGKENSIIDGVRGTG